MQQRRRRRRKKRSRLPYILITLSVIILIIYIVSINSNRNELIDENISNVSEQFEDDENNGNTGNIDDANEESIREETAAILPESEQEVEPMENENVQNLPINVDSYDYSYSDSLYYEADMPPLFNRMNPIPADFQLDLAYVGNHQVHAKAAPALRDMMQAAADDGVSLQIISAHRTNARQTANFNNGVNSRMAQGMSQSDAENATARWIAVPGTSEHEAGLAVDFNMLEERFNQTREYQWLRENGADFGFILRYEKETEDITGIAYEPWHFRYVGINHAKKITELGITLDEYVNGN
jgi:D-alanyl-D-alanine carboxypeptidase